MDEPYTTGRALRRENITTWIARSISGMTGYTVDQCMALAKRIFVLTAIESKDKALTDLQKDFLLLSFEDAQAVKTEQISDNRIWSVPPKERIPHWVFILFTVWFSGVALGAALVAFVILQ